MMKTRFGSLDGIHEIKKKNIVGTTIISAISFLIIFVVFLLAVSKMTQRGIEEQKRSLSQAIDRAVIQCYALEGRYPQSFDYLKEKYGIIYDDEMFRVDYVIFGSNMKPDVTIIELK